MREEIHAAATWLATAIAGADDPQHDDIVDALSQALTARFADHWYVSEPHRGCAFRAVECTRWSLDPLVERALKVSPAHLDTHRQQFRLKQKGIAKMYVEILALNEASEDAQVRGKTQTRAGSHAAGLVPTLGC